MDFYQVLFARKFGLCSGFYEAQFGRKLGGYSWLSDYEETPYLYRAMPNMSHYYNREIMEEVVGGSVGWNQLCNGSSVTVQSGHKYFLKKGSAESVATSAGSAITGLTSGSDIVVDLTLALGSTIADYVYSLEQSTAGAGVAWLKEHFPKMFSQYNPYDSGSIQSVSGLVSHDTVGFNQWDEEWELGYLNPTTGGNASSNDCIRAKNYNAVLPNTLYYVKVPSVSGVNCKLYFYDENKGFISWATKLNEAFTTPSNARYLRFYISNQYGTTYNHDICINLSDASRNGQYEPYSKSSYPLDSTLTLRGIPKLDNGNLYYDGDTYEADGTVVRKYGIVDLGSLSWEYDSARQSVVTTAQLTLANRKDASSRCNMICPLYVTDSANNVESKVANKTISLSYNKYIRVYDTAYTDAASFKTAMSGVYLVYELATPTTETAQPFTKTQLCDSGGTEEFITSGIVSVGHKSKYAEK